MKKAIFLLLALVLMLAAAACQPPHLDNSPSVDAVQPSDKKQPLPDEQNGTDIQMSVKEQIVAGDAESVTLTVANVSDKDYTYGAMWALQTEKNGNWQDVKPIEDMMWIEIAYVISPGQTNEDELKINDYYGTLAPGNYRIVKTFTDTEGNGLTAYAPFTIK